MSEWPPHTHPYGNIAPCAYLVILRGDLCWFARQHLGRPLRIGELLPAPFSQRVEHDDRNIAFAYRLKGMQQAGGIRPNILPEGQDAVGVIVIFK